VLIPEALRRDNGVLSGKTESVMKSEGYKNTANKNQETPEAGKGGGVLG
jgi:hypothetical protein